MALQYVEPFFFFQYISRKVFLSMHLWEIHQFFTVTQAYRSFVAYKNPRQLCFCNKKFESNSSCTI